MNNKRKMKKKISHKRQRRLLHTNTENNSVGGYINCKYTHTKCKCNEFHKGNTTTHKNSERPQHNIYSLSPTDRYLIKTKKINKETSELNDTTNQMDLTYNPTLQNTHSSQ
jgi:hypothetical protein